VTPDARDYGFAEKPVVEVRTIGEECEPLVVVDGAMRNPRALVDYAAEEARFAPLAEAENFYPGVRAPAPRGYPPKLLAQFRPVIDDVFEIPATARMRGTCALSIVTLEPEQLNLPQRLPHFDTVDPRQIAALHYLCDPRWGGTAFYRHRATGFETLSAERVEYYFTTLREEIAACPPTADYVRGDTDLFEETARVEARFDRLVIYRSRLLHSGVVDPSLGLSADPRRGRLTANAFFAFSQG
jgi:hypothetical protein